MSEHRPDRRRRYKRPRILLLFVVLILALPVSNYIGLSLKNAIQPWLPHKVFLTLSWRENLFLASALCTAVGLYMIKKWGFWFFAVASTVFVSHNVVVFIQYPSTAQKGPLFHTLLVIAAMVYFFRKDIYTPYMENYKRGWRFLKRYPITLDVLVDGASHRTSNVSAGGIYVLWPDCHILRGTAVSLRFKITDETHDWKGGIATVNPGHGVGIAFRGLDSDQKHRLRGEILTALHTKEQQVHN